jgi:hypothetical protein
VSDANDMTAVTRRELREEFRAFEERLDQKLANYPTTAQTESMIAANTERLLLFLQAREERLLGNIGSMLAATELRLRAELGRDIVACEERLRADLGRDIVASEERLRAEFRVLDDRYDDLPKRVANLEQLPARVSRLESAVFPPKRKRR